MIVAGMLLVLVGFALLAPRGGLPGATAARNISLGRTTLFRTRGYQGEEPSRRYRVIQVLMGLVVIGGGFVLIAAST